MVHINTVAYTLSHKKTYRDVLAYRPTASLAVVIHLFYIDNWELFERRLKSLDEINFDLFITMPENNLSFVGAIRHTYPKARIIVVPNHGRDVLPFVTVASALSKNGYKYVLKFHSKKSTHWDGGQSWLEGMMERLLPKNPRLIQQILKTLEDENTGIIGPADVYYPLTINFPANGLWMTKVMNRIFNKAMSERILQKHRSDYGFFGGTMFWARLDAIMSVINDSKVHFYPTEKGQIDGTYAHALERLFCIVPEANNKQIYELTKTKIQERSYRSDNIPEWSEDHDK